MTKQEKENLANTYINTLKRANAFNKNLKDSSYPDFILIKNPKKIDSITFPTISTGIFGCITKESAEPGVENIVKYLMNNTDFSLKEIIFVFYDPINPKKALEDLNYYKSAFEDFLKIKAFV